MAKKQTYPVIKQSKDFLKSVLHVILTAVQSYLDYFTAAISIFIIGYQTFKNKNPRSPSMFLKEFIKVMLASRLCLPSMP